MDPMSSREAMSGVSPVQSLQKWKSTAEILAPTGKGNVSVRSTDTELSKLSEGHAPPNTDKTAWVM